MHRLTRPLARLCLAAAATLMIPALQAQTPVTASANSSSLSVHWEELTGPDFVQAIKKAQNTCVLPIGIMEKHGPQLPIGTDLFDVRYVALHAAQKEYAVVFPPYYFGQIFEARHQPGTLAYSAHIQMELLQATVDEMGRNGCRKIIIVNGHGGNESFLPYFAQTQLAQRHNFAVYIFGLPDLNQPGRPPLHTTLHMHAGEDESSHLMIARPDLAHIDRSHQQSGADQHRLHLPKSLYTGIWWYARFPNHYAGDGSYANRKLGEFDMNTWINQVAEAIKAVKADQETLKLQNEFYDQAEHPLDTPQ